MAGYAPSSPGDEPHWLTLTFGNDGYVDDELDNLNTCEQDAVNVHRAFHMSGLCQKDDQKLLKPESSAEDIRAAVAGMVDRMRHGSSLWISYFGHAIDHNDTCLIQTRTSKFNENSSDPWTETVALSSLAKSRIAERRWNNATLVCTFACCRPKDGSMQSMLDRDSTAEARPHGFRCVEVFTCEPAHCTNDLSLIACSFCYLLMRMPADLDQFLNAWKSEVRHVTLTHVCLNIKSDPSDSDTTKMFSSDSAFPDTDTILKRNAVEWWQQPARTILAWHLRCMVDEQFSSSPSSTSEELNLYGMLSLYETSRSQVRKMGETIFAREVDPFHQLPAQTPLLRCQNIEEVMQVLEQPCSESHSFVEPLDPRTKCIPERVLQSLAEFIEGRDKKDIEDWVVDLWDVLNWLGQYHRHMSIVFYNLGRLKLCSGDLLKSQEYLLQSLKVEDDLGMDDHLAVAQALQALAMLYFLQGNMPGGRACLQEALRRKDAIDSLDSQRLCADSLPRAVLEKVTAAIERAEDGVSRQLLSDWRINTKESERK